jgi:hypothetical protein
MSILHAAPPQAETEQQWGKTPEACATVKVGPSRLYEILLNRAEEDPEGIIQTFVLKAPRSKRGTRLFELNSLRCWLNWKYERAQEEERHKAHQAFYDSIGIENPAARQEEK